MTACEAHRRVTIAYLALVLLAGGASAAGLAVNFLLQMTGAALAIWSLRLDAPRPGAFALAVGVLAAVQFVPLPPVVWERLPGHDEIAQAFSLSGLKPPWLTLSLSPWRSVASLSWALPALSLFLAARVHGRSLARPAARTVVVTAAVSLLLGAAQVLRGAGYIYAVTNYGEAPGFFANSNHQSLFLLIALILCIEDAWHDRSHREASLGGAAGDVWWLLAPLFVLGIIVNGSLAVAILLVPACCALFMALSPRPVRWGGALVPAGTVLLVLTALAAVAGDILPNDLFGRAHVAGIGRHAFWATAVAMIGRFAPLGSGLGTFQYVYHWFEDPAMVTTVFVNHAHNDLLELLAETGVFGAAAVIAFLLWFVPAAVRAWRAPQRDSAVLAATIVIGTALLHSLVDYPLRTAALSSVFAVACAIVGAGGASHVTRNDPASCPAEA